MNCFLEFFQISFIFLNYLTSQVIHSTFLDFQSFFVIIIVYLKTSLPGDSVYFQKCLQRERNWNGISRKRYMLKNPALRAQ